MAGITVVAKLAEVPLGPISKVINGKGAQRPRFAPPGQTAIELLNYPLYLASGSLKISRTSSIGVFGSDAINLLFHRQYPGSGQNPKEHLKRFQQA